MKFTKRDMEMIEYLKDSETVDLISMSDYLEVSVKTLKNQLKELSKTMEEYGITIQFLSGNQVIVNGHDKFPDIMRMSIPRFEMEFERRVLLLLVLHDNFLIIQDIADKLLVSKSYAEKQLAAIMKKYPEDIQSQRHYGIRYAASQDKRRALFVKIMFPYLFGEDYELALRQFHQLHFPILGYFTVGQMRRAWEAVERVQKMEWFRFTDESMQQIYLYVLFLARHADSSNTEKPRIEGWGISKEPEYDGLYTWTRRMIQELSLPDSEEETQYLYILLLSLRKQKSAFQDQIYEKMQHPVSEILRKIYEKLRVDFRGDEELVQGLSGHLYTTVLRGDRMDVESDFYMIKSMKRQYPFGFEMAAIAADYIYDIYQLSMKEDDLVYLAIHFQAAIERMKDEMEKTKIVIVCHFGAAAAKIIRSKIERKISNVEIVGMYSLREFAMQSHVDCDCIVTTERILQTDCPVINISIALPEQEIRKIADYIRQIQINHLLEINLLEAVILHIDEKTMEGALTQMTRPLIEEGFVEEEYPESVMEREKISPTSLCHIAMPHGNPSLVHATKLVIGRMDKPVLWDDTKVCCAFLFAISADLLKEKPMLFSTFYRVLANPGVEEKIKKLQTEENLTDEVFRQKLFQILK
ncbi:MAG: PTS sugar transporter subunit IIA [Eubacteriales bacterium]|nr:PTS sugar transporter subunit IIA [Eubacteriales bacterium]